MTLDNLIGNTLERIEPDPDAIRRQRNVSDYSGDPVPASAMGECIASAEALLDDVRTWLESHRPDCA